jgi:hypothetical protein
MLERCSGTIDSQELPEQRSGVQKMSSSVAQASGFGNERLAKLPKKACQFSYH